VTIIERGAAVGLGCSLGNAGLIRTDHLHPLATPRAVADGLRVPRAIGDFLILRAIRESGGTAVAVPDSAMIEGMLEIGKCEGISASPEGGAGLAAVRRLVADRLIKRSDSVVLFNTGGALKYLEVMKNA